MRKYVNPGDIVGSWKIIERVGTVKSGGIIWKVKCVCGKESRKSTTHLNAAEKLGLRCGCLQKQTGFQEIRGKYWKSILQKARMRGINVFVTIEEVWQLFIQQDRKCALTNLPLSFGKGQTASLDRIDSKKEYTIDNIQWVHKDINWMKNRYSNEKFIEYCLLVAKNRCKIEQII